MRAMLQRGKLKFCFLSVLFLTLPLSAVFIYLTLNLLNLSLLILSCVCVAGLLDNQLLTKCWNRIILSDSIPAKYQLLNLLAEYRRRIGCVVLSRLTQLQ